jgi:hypothetical protein
MKRILLAIALLSLGIGGANAAATKGPPYLLEEGTWVCVTPEAYDQAMAEQGKISGFQELMALKDRMLEAKLCQYVDDDDIEDMMAPFVEVIERQGDKIKVTFTIEFYKKLAELHRSFNRVKFAGWTAEERLADYHPLGGL